MEEVATSLFQRSKGGPFGRLWVVQYHCLSFSVHQGNSYFTFLGIKGRRPGEYPGGTPESLFLFCFMKEIVILPFRGQREYPFGRSNIIVFPALFIMEIATSPFGKSKGVPFGKLWVV